MKKILPHGLIAICLLQSAVCQIQINEIDADTPSADTLEFIEIYAGGAEVTPLDGHVLVLFNGLNESSYATYDLDGFSTNGDGFFVIGSAEVDNVGLIVSSGSSGFIQNGADAVAIYTGSSADFPNGTLATTVNLVDSLIYGTSDEDDTELLAVFGGMQIDENGGGDGANESIQRNPDGAETFMTSSPTPGTTNRQLPRLTLTLDPPSVSEGSGADAITAELVTEDLVSGDLLVTVFISDGSELAGPLTVTIPDGESAVSFSLDAVNDSVMDGEQSVEVAVSATGYLGSSVTVLVGDDDLVLPELVINEMIIDSVGGGDTEFLEIYNAGEVTVDLAGYSIEKWDSDSGISFGGVDGGGAILIPAEVPVLLAPGGYYLLASPSFMVSYAGVEVDLMIADNNFENGSATIVLRDADGNVIHTVFATDGGADDVANIAGTPIAPDAIGNDRAFALLPDGDSSRVVSISNAVPSLEATPGATNGLPPTTSYTVELSSSSFADGQFTMNFTASGSSDVYVSTDLQRFTLANDGEGIPSGVYTDTAPPGDQAFYFIQEAGAPAP